MKKIRLIATAMMIVIALGLQGQTAITYNNHSPQIGHSFTVRSYADPFNLDPGPAGANVTWNFAAFSSSDEFIVGYIDPAETVFADDIAGTAINLAIEIIDDFDFGYAFLKVNQQQMTFESVGYLDDFGANYLYTAYNPPPTMMVYPFAFGNSFDTYGEIMFNFDDEYIIHNKEWTTTTADAWGTLITPTDTYQNVLRVKTTSVDSSYFYFDGELFSAELSVSVDYTWYGAGYRFPLLSLNGEMEDDVFYPNYIDYLVDETVKVDEPVASLLNIFPNPASDVLNISNVSSGTTAFLLIDLLGKTVAEIPVAFDAGTASINLSQFPEGVYFLQEIREAEAVASTKVMIRR